MDDLQYVNDVKFGDCYSFFFINLYCLFLDPRNASTDLVQGHAVTIVIIVNEAQEKIVIDDDHHIGKVLLLGRVYGAH